MVIIILLFPIRLSYSSMLSSVIVFLQRKELLLVFLVLQICLWQISPAIVYLYFTRTSWYIFTFAQENRSQTKRDKDVLYLNNYYSKESYSSVEVGLILSTVWKSGNL